MKKQRNKFAYLLVGVFIGVLIAFSIVWWQGHDIGRWGFLKKVKSYFSSVFTRHEDNDIAIINEKSNNKKTVNIKQKMNNAELKNDSAYYDTTNNVNFYDPNALDEFLAKYNGHLPDSLVVDSIIKSQKNVEVNSYSNSNNVEIKKDRLIYAKSFIVPGIELFSGDNPGKLDSLLTDNKTTIPIKNKNALLVEFWKSPINYKGYKTGKNKIVLFGIDKYDIISFKVLNNILYMKYVSDFYQIDKSIDFKSLIPINNPQLLSQLNNK